MTQKLANLLKKAADHCGNQDAEVRDDYIGRGRSQETYAVMVNSLPQLLSDVIQYMRDGIEANEGAETGIVNLLATIPNVQEEEGHLSIDTMGHDIVIY